MKEKILYSASFQRILRIPDLQRLIISLLMWDFLRRAFLNWVKKGIYDYDVVRNPDNRPAKVQEEKYLLGKALIESIDSAFSKKLISPQYALGLVYNLLWNVLLFGAERRKKFLEKEGRKPALYMTIGICAGCNLKCKDCSATSEIALKQKLPFEGLKRIISEGRDIFGMRFFVITGGEPFLWKDKGRDVLDLIEMFRDCFFLIFTNATMVNEEKAERLAKLGNATLGISIEGYEKETDDRRGKGIHKRILKTMFLLRKLGVPYGVSVTAKKQNIELVTSHEFFNYCFNNLKVVYCWIFQYMPIGRHYDTGSMPTAKQQVAANLRVWVEVRTYGWFIVDFWSMGCAADGCVCAFREGGYCYIDWNGNVAPCVFFPYYTDNILKAFSEGKNSKTVTIDSPFFQAINDLQDRRGFNNPDLSSEDCYVNFKFAPCPHRHCFGDLLKIVKEFDAKGLNAEAEESLKDKEHAKRMIAHGREVKDLGHALITC